MEYAVGPWDVDLQTRLVSIGPAGGAIGSLRLPERALPLAELEGHLHGEDREALASAIFALIDGTAPGLRHEFRIGSGGSWTWVEVMGRRSADGRALSGVWADITERKAAEGRKDEAVARIHQFAAAASHDLIGPLRHIAMYGYMLIGDFGTGATEEKRQMLQAIADKTRTLQGLTKRLIAFSTDTAAPESVTVPLDRALANVGKRMANELDETGAVLAVNALPDVIGDPVLIEKVFENVIRNAIEWRGTRTPAIAIRGVANGRSVKITVTDNGVGIDPRYAARIFDAFWSLPRPGEAKGAGLGLAVCKTITHALGGQITLADSSPEGSTFEIVLPASG
jgi:light-regulated signal transduction histidine kinase (bacteriophytochrome)